MARTIIIFLLAAVYAVPTVAAPLSVRVVDAKGRPVRDAVVTLRPIGVAARPAAASGSYSVSQEGMQFHPFVSVVPVGASVSFPNRDATKHHVYSFSPAKRFELKLFARDQSRSVRFDKPGVIALGCNIHDSMSARLTVQFALLFAVAMLGVSAALSTFIAGAASHQVESQLQSSGAVYDRLWQQRQRELQSAAQLLARDFGFRAAVATHDTATMESALGNAAARLRVKNAFIVSLDGGLHGIDDPAVARQAAGLWAPLDEG